MKIICLTDYKGHIVIKKATNGSDITNSWLQENDFALYENYPMEIRRRYK